jgi:hypothetical protein
MCVSLGWLEAQLLDQWREKGLQYHGEGQKGGKRRQENKPF